MADEWPLFAHLELGALLTAPSVSRQWTRLVLAQWRMYALADTAELVVSELVTNAVQATSTPDGFPIYDAEGYLPVVHLVVRSDHARLLIEVWDSVPDVFGAPVPKEASDYDESGRGLSIVESMSQSWGFKSVPGWVGKFTWSLLSIQQLLHNFGGGNPIRRSSPYGIYQSDPDRGNVSGALSGVLPSNR